MDDPKTSTTNNNELTTGTTKSQAEIDQRATELVKKGYDPGQAKLFAAIELANEKRELLAEKSKQTTSETPKRTKRAKYDVQRQGVMSKLQYKSATDFYIGSDVNLAGLSANAFRVLAYIKSQAGGYGRSYRCPIRKMMRICGIGQKAVMAAIKELTEGKFISCRKQNRKTTEFTVLGPEHWCSWLTVKD